MKRILLSFLVVTLAGCGASRRAERPDAYVMTRDDSCYTVDLFTAVNFVPPGNEVPSEWRGFAGRWGGGAWAGAWCHDLYVLEIMPDGLVKVVDTHAPLPEWGKPATAFRRTARIDSDNRLRMRYGNTVVEYWLEDGKLLGHRDEGNGALRIAMVQR